MSAKDQTDLMMLGLLAVSIYLLVRRSRAASRPDTSGFTVPAYEHYAAPEETRGSDGEDGCC